MRNWEDNRYERTARPCPRRSRRHTLEIGQDDRRRYVDHRHALGKKRLARCPEAGSRHGRYRRQRVSYQPFTKPDWRSVYHPEAVAIETSNGKPIKSRANPRAAFQGHTVETAWDDLHLAYFSGYAIWNYLNTPFLFQLPGFKTEEIEPWDEPSERRRRLKVTFPDAVATHCPEQVFHVGGDGLISRVDYGAVVTGRIPMAHYMSEYRDFDGVKIATKRRAYRRRADGTAITEGVVVAIDIADIRLS